MSNRTLLGVVALAAVGVAGLAACSNGGASSTTLSAEQRTEIVSAVKARHRVMLDVWSKEDAFDAWMALYVRDDHPAWAEERNLLTVSGADYQSRAEIGETFREILKDRATQVTVRDEYVAVLSPTTAVHFGDFTWSATRKGVTDGPYAASATTIWVIEDGEWKILHHHQSWPSTTPVPAK